MTAPPMHKITTVSPFELVAMDLVALDPSHGNIGCLVVMNHHTMWLCAAPVQVTRGALDAQ